MKRVLILPVFAILFTVLLLFPHNASASPHMSVAVTGGIDPGTIVTISGSGFSSSDSFITINGGMNAHFIATPDSTPCLLTNGAFSCTFFAFPSGGGDATQILEAVGNSGDFAIDSSFIYGFHHGLGTYPSQASVGTTVTVYGSGYLGDLIIKGVPIGDQDLKVFFNNGLVAEGIEPSFHLVTPGSTTTCYPTDGSLDDNGPCTFVVPPIDPGTYTITATAYSFGLQTESFSIPFTVITPSVDASPTEAIKGSTVTLNGSNFAGLDTSGRILWRGADVTPPSGCRFFNLYQTGNFFQCSINVPTSGLASSGPNSITVIGDKIGDYASAKVDIPGPYPLTVSSSQVTIGSSITVSGEAFPPSDTFVTLSIGSQPGNSGPTCPLTNGAFSCSFTIPSGAPTGNTQVFALGNNGGQDDFDFADLSVGPGISLLQTSSTVGTTIQINGAGFSFGSTLTMKFDGQSLAFTDLSTGGFFGNAPSQQDPNCHVESLFFTCFLTVPPTTSGSHTITVTDGSSNSASTTLQVNPSVSVAPPTTQFGISSISNLLLSQSQGTTRTIVSVSTFGLSSSETAAHVMFGNFFVGFGDGCPVVSGSYTCPFIVPTSLPPGPYPLQVIDNNGNTLSTGTFDITSPLTGILDTLQFPAGTTVSVSTFGLKSSDTSATMTFNGESVGPPSGCQVSGGSIVSSCTFTIPSGMSSGTYNLQVTGNSGGTASVTIAVLPAISISPQSAQSGSTTSVSLSGSGFASTDTSAKISLGSMVLGNCPVNSGALSCSSSFAVPLNLTASVYPVTAVGDKQGDTGLTTFGLTGVAMTTIGQQNNPIGISQSGFSPYDKSFSVIFNGQTIQTCSNVGAIFSGIASPPSSSCQFTVPRINAGFYPVKVEGSTGDFATSTFQVEPSISSIPDQGPVGTAVSITGFNFASSDTSATITFNGTDVTPSSGCQISGGTIPFSSCSFTVPSTKWGSYNIVAIGSSGDVATTTFAVEPSVMLSPSQGPTGTQVAVSGNNFAPNDTSATMTFNGKSVGPPSGCQVSGGSIVSPCTATVSTGLSPGTYYFVVTGNADASCIFGGDCDQGFVPFIVQAPSVSLTSSTSPVGSSVEVNGSGFSSSDTSATITFSQQPNGQTDVTPSGGCQVSGGSIVSSSCVFTVPTKLSGGPVLESSAGGTYIVTVTGNTGDQGATSFNAQVSFAVTPTIISQGKAVTVSGAGYACGEGTPCSDINFIAFNPATSTTLFVTPDFCPLTGGVFTCSVTIPNDAPQGSYTFEGITSFDNPSATITIPLPPFTVSPTEGTIGSSLTISGGTFAPSDTSATLTFSHPTYGQVDVTPSGGCPIVGNTMQSCTFTIPTQLSGGPVLDSFFVESYNITATGNSGDTFSTSVFVTPSVVVTPSSIFPGKTITISGEGYACFDKNSNLIPCTSINFSAFNTNNNNQISITPTSCPTTGSSFSCTLTIPTTDPPGGYFLDVVTPSFSFGQGSFTISTPDTIPPVIAPISNQTIEATGPSGAVATFTATATDDVDGTDSVTCNPASDSTFAIGSTLITCNSQDNAGNQATPVTFTIIVQDTTPPILTLPSDITQEATGPSGNVVMYTTSANDLVDGSVTPQCTPSSGSTFAVGTTAVNCSVTDSHGNKATGSFNVKIQDTTPPSIMTSDVTSEATGPSGAAVTFTVSATDIVDGTVPVTCDHNSGDTFPLGTTTVNCSATDKSGNKATTAFHVIVQDTTPPTLTTTDINAKATGALTPVTFTVSATDIVDGTVPVTCDHNSGDTFLLGTTTVNCSATDAHGNKATGSFKITVAETTAPSITTSDITKEAIGPIGDAITFTVSATDIVDGTDPVTCNPASGSVFSIGTTTVTCTSTNKAGNTGTSTFNVIVQDTTPPTLTLQSDITKEATGQLTPVTFTVSATDIVDGTDPVTCNPASGSSFSLGTTPVLCSSTDAHGNKASGTFNVIIQDTTPPTLVIQSPANNGIVNVATIAVFGTASDNVQVSKVTWKVDNGPVSTATGTAGWSFTTGTLSTGTHTISVSATDEAGLVTTSPINITYVAPTDTLPPPSGGTKPITFMTSSGGFTSLVSIPRSNLPTPPPPGNYPLGFFSWDITGFAPSKSVTVTVTSPTTLYTQSHYFKLIGGTWVSIPVSVHGNKMTFTITDNGPFDGNPTVGVISDPGAVVNPTDGKITGGGNIGTNIDFSFEVSSDIDKTGITHGTIEFHDKSGDINLHSNRVSFLSVDSTVSQATFSGTGDLGNKHNYIFIVSIADPDKTGNHDTFTITITDNTGKIVYQNTGTVKGHIEIHKFSDKDDKSDSGGQNGNN